MSRLIWFLIWCPGPVILSAKEKHNSLQSYHKFPNQESSRMTPNAAQEDKQICYMLHCCHGECYFRKWFDVIYSFLIQRRFLAIRKLLLSDRSLPSDDQIKSFECLVTNSLSWMNGLTWLGMMDFNCSLWSVCGMVQPCTFTAPLFDIPLHLHSPFVSVNALRISQSTIIQSCPNVSWVEPVIIWG